jgi:hypothetical protein
MVLKFNIIKTIALNWEWSRGVKKNSTYNAFLICEENGGKPILLD